MQVKIRISFFLLSDQIAEGHFQSKKWSRAWKDVGWDTHKVEERAGIVLPDNDPKVERERAGAFRQSFSSEIDMVFNFR